MSPGRPRNVVSSSWPPDDLVRNLEAELLGRRSSVALVLGSGLGGIADGLQDAWIRSSDDIPGYPTSTVPGHQGRLMLGRFGGREIWVVQGRVHFYEGYTVDEVTRYVRLLHRLGVHTLILTNAAGSVVSEVGPGDVVLAVDAINLFFRCLAVPVPPSGLRAGGSGVDGSGADGPGTGASAADSQELWRARTPLSDPDLVRLAEETAREERIALRLGVLVGSLGPSYETAAEVKVWRRLGGTVASMSTVPEAIAARELGMRCLLFSLVSNHATGLSREALTHADVVAQAGIAGERLARLLKALVGRI